MLSSKAKRELKIDQRQILIDSIEIGISSPQQICLWGSRLLPNGKKVGLVKNSKTVNYKRFTPFRDGLFCERIFGPVTSLVCACGKKQPHSKITFCEKCEVEYIDQRSRRYRLGYISLLSPVTHIWYLKGRPSYLSLFLGKRKKTIVALAYCNAYLIELAHLKKDAENHIWPFMRSHSNLEKLLENNLYRSSCNFKNTGSPPVMNPSLNKQLSEKKQFYTSQIGSSSLASRAKLHFTSLRRDIFEENQNTHFSRSYRAYSYVRQHALPFLPTFVSHFYLRDALLNFLYASAHYTDVPLIEYCQTRRWQPLQDVHKLMARQSINDFKADLSTTYKQFSLDSRKILRNNLSLASPTAFTFGGSKTRNYQRKSYESPKICKHLKQKRKNTVDLWKTNHIKESTDLKELTKVHHFGAYKSKMRKGLKYKSLFFSKQNSFNRLLKNNNYKLNLDKKKWSYFGHETSKFNHGEQKEGSPVLQTLQLRTKRSFEVFEKIARISEVSQKVTLNISLPSYRANARYRLADASRMRGKREFARALLRKASERGSQTLGDTCVSRSRRAGYRTRGITKLRFVSSQRTVSLLTSLRESLLSKPKRSFVRDPYKAPLYKQSRGFPHCARLCSAKQKEFKVNNADRKTRVFGIQSQKNSQKTSFAEDTNSASLSHLELTTIREILSYTGGGALQQLLQRFDQHDLCKYLLAEKQILRILYQKHSTYLADEQNTKDTALAVVQRSIISEGTTNSSFFDKNSPRWCLANARQARVCSANQNNDLHVERDFSTNFAPPIDLSAPLSRCRKIEGNRGYEKLVSQQEFSTQICIKLVKDAKKSDLQKKQAIRVSRRIYKVARRLKVVELLTLNHRRPEWMILSHLPVLPPELRPILQMSENVIVASDLNIMYQRVIYRNNRHLRVRFIDFHLVTAIQRLVQDAVDRLMENGKGGSKPYYTQGGRPLKSLSDILKGKKGRFRLNLLGKRVDFSGRSVIVVAPSLKIHECGLPKDIALELYHYFLLRQLIVRKYCASIVTAKKMIKSKSSLMWDILRELMYHHPVLLNRAPTLHRLGIQAFQPKLVLGNAIWLHPLVCSGFNADFDGDQMGVHLPLSFAARAESWDLLWSRNNLLSPATGQPMLVPSQDMVLGFYYMTAKAMKGFSKNASSYTSLQSSYLADASRSVPRICEIRGKQGKLYKAKLCTRSALYPSLLDSFQKSQSESFKQSSFFLNRESIITSLQSGNIKLHTPVWLYWSGKVENENVSQIPLELRVQSFGLQRSIYEKYIASSFFRKTEITNLPHFKNLRTNNKITESNLLLTNGNLDSRFSKNLSLASSFGDTLARDSFLKKSVFSYIVCAEDKTYYIRTTPGRVLMNNLMNI